MMMGTLVEVSVMDLMEDDIIYSPEVDMYSMVTVDEDRGLCAVILLDEKELPGVMDELMDMGVMIAYKLEEGKMYTKLIQEDV